MIDEAVNFSVGHTCPSIKIRRHGTFVNHVREAKFLEFKMTRPPKPAQKQTKRISIPNVPF